MSSSKKNIFFIIWALPQGSGFSLYLFVFKEKTKRMPLQSLTQKNKINFTYTVKQEKPETKKPKTKLLINKVLKINKLGLFS